MRSASLRAGLRQSGVNSFLWSPGTCEGALHAPSTVPGYFLSSLRDWCIEVFGNLVYQALE